MTASWLLLSKFLLWVAVSPGPCLPHPRHMSVGGSSLGCLHGRILSAWCKHGEDWRSDICLWGSFCETVSSSPFFSRLHAGLSFSARRLSSTKGVSKWASWLPTFIWLYFEGSESSLSWFFDSKSLRNGPLN